MTFVSFEYLALLALTVALYYLLPWRARVLLVLLASYVFYCYWEPWYGYLIAGTAFFGFAWVDFSATVTVTGDSSTGSRTGSS